MNSTPTPFEHDEDRARELYILQTAKAWLGAVVQQGNRVLSLQESQQPPRDAGPDAFFRWAREREQMIDLSSQEDHFFVIAVGKALDWLKAARNVDQSTGAILEEFSRALPDARDIRNMREHEEEYLVGKGRAQSRYVKHREEHVGGIAIDGSSTLVVGNERFIGGRLSVQLAMSVSSEALTKLKPLLEQAEQARFPHGRPFS